MFKTVRQTAAAGIAPENYIRRLIHEHKCPGVYSGTRFLINVEALREYLDKLSREGKEGMTQ